ncbi:hypothetical protein KAT08_02315 [Candidatus Babeliales bacterium]|nr:hypothetical protein [Candidatus Babeliales bacterium]
MNKTAQLVIHFEKKNSFLALIVMSVMIIVMTVGLFYFSRSNIIFFPGVSFLSFLISFVIKAVLYFGIGLFTFGIIYGLFSMQYKGPAAILDRNGIWIKHYNFIPWKNIEEFTSYPMFGTVEGIGIKVKDVEVLSKQSDWSGKLGIFWAKLFGNYHITLSNIDIKNEDIISFVRLYI